MEYAKTFSLDFPAEAPASLRPGPPLGPLLLRAI